jgi:hypothetical protein
LDLLLDSTGDCVFVNGETPVTSTDFEVVGQRLTIRLKTFKGEWIFNTEYGVPYFQRIFGKRVRKQEVDNIFQQEILKEQGVVEILEFSSSLSNNIYNLSFKVKNDKTRISPTIEIQIII